VAPHLGCHVSVYRIKIGLGGQNCYSRNYSHGICLAPHTPSIKVIDFSMRFVYGIQGARHILMYAWWCYRSINLEIFIKAIILFLTFFLTPTINHTLNEFYSIAVFRINFDWKFSSTCIWPLSSPLA